jgi:protein-S-isoprenylcysteine O-methyltransferase Ste14
VNTSLIFKTLFFILFVGILAIRLFFGLKVRRAGQDSWSVEKDAVRREGGWSIVLRPLSFLVLLALVAGYAILPGESAWLILPLPAWIRWIGAVLGVFGLICLIWVHQALREYWSTVLQLRETHVLIITGPYHWIRHPMYSALMLCFLSLAITSAAWPLLLLAIGTVPFFFRVTVKEEEMMIGQFGDEYREYMKYTGRFIPQLFFLPARQNA